MNARNSPARRTSRIPVGAMIAVLIFVAAASPRPPQAMDFVLEGKIIRKVQDKLTVNTGQNIVFTVRYDDKTEIRKADGGEGSPDDLRVGVKVKVEGELTESGEVLAVKIKIQA